MTIYAVSRGFPFAVQNRGDLDAISVLLVEKFVPLDKVVWTLTEEEVASLRGNGLELPEDGVTQVATPGGILNVAKRQK